MILIMIIYLEIRGGFCARVCVCIDKCGCLYDNVDEGGHGSGKDAKASSLLSGEDIRET